MLTRLKFKQGEGALTKFNPEIGKQRTFPQAEMATEQSPTLLDEKYFHKYFLEMKSMVEVLFQERKKWKKRKEGKARKKEEAESSLKEDKGKGVGGGGNPPEPPSLSSSSSSSSSSSTSSFDFSKKKQPVQTHLLKLDVKFELPIYNGELDVEKLDNCLKQIKVYCRVQ